jgi:dihydropteroate synthase
MKKSPSKLNNLFHQKKTLLMGILNVTPDSFYAKSRCNSLESAMSRAQEMINEGVDIIDIGGESSRPGANEVSEEEEIRRVLPVIQKIKKIDPNLIISIDTVKPSVAKVAVEAGATLLNDISGFREGDMIDLAISSQIHICLMHMQNTPKTMQINPQYKNGVISDLMKWFEQKIDILLTKGIDENQIIIDPGIGFGKTVEDNLTILKNIKKFQTLGFPLLLGISRKSFMGKLLNKTTDTLLPATLGINMHLIRENINILRVHDVKEHRELIEIAGFL